jgi:hypothetical protein
LTLLARTSLPYFLFPNPYTLNSNPARKKYPEKIQIFKTELTLITDNG